MDSDVEPIITDPKLRIVSREEWGAAAPTFKEPIKLPAHRVFFTMTDTRRCMTKAQCIQSAREIQQFYMSRKGMPDLPYSFLIGGDLRVYEGRGWGVKIREAAEPMEQPTWKTGRVVIGYIAKSNDNKKHMLKMLEKGDRLVNMGIDNNYLVNFNKHSFFRDVDYDNELEVEKFEDYSRKVKNQFYQGFVPENEVIFDRSDDDDELDSEYELKTEDEREPPGDLMEDIDRGEEEEVIKKAIKMKKKVEDVYGCSDEDIMHRDKKARTYGEEEYIGDYSDHHFDEDTGSTSELGHTTDGEEDDEIEEDYPKWVTAKEDLEETFKKTFDGDKTAKRGQKNSNSRQPLEPPTVNDELHTLFAELKRNEESKNGVECNDKKTGDIRCKNSSDRHNEDEAEVNQGKDTSRPCKLNEELNDIVEFERYRDGKMYTEYNSEDTDVEHPKIISGIETDKAGKENIPEDSAQDISRTFNERRESNKHSINNTKQINRKKYVKKRTNSSNGNKGFKHNAKSFSGITSSDEELKVERTKFLKEFTEKTIDFERKRKEIGDFSPNDSDDYYSNSKDENTFTKESQNISKDIKQDYINRNSEEEDVKTTNKKYNNLDSSKVTKPPTDPYPVTDSSLNTSQLTDTHESSVKYGSVNEVHDIHSNIKLTDPLTNTYVNDNYLPSKTKDETNKNLIMDHKKYFKKVNIAVIKKYLSGKNEFISTGQFTEDFKRKGEEREINIERNYSRTQGQNVNDQENITEENDKTNDYFEWEEDLNIRYENISGLNHNEEESKLVNKDKGQNNVGSNNNDNDSKIKCEDDLDTPEVSENNPILKEFNENEIKKTGVYQKYGKGSHFENEEHERYYNEKIKPYNVINRDNRSKEEVNSAMNSLLKGFYGEDYDKLNSTSKYYEKKLGWVDSTPESSLTEPESSEFDPMDL